MNTLNRPNDDHPETEFHPYMREKDTLIPAREWWKKHPDAIAENRKKLQESMKKSLNKIEQKIYYV